MTVVNEAPPAGATLSLVERFEGLVRRVWPYAILILVAYLVLWPMGSLIYGAFRSDTPGAPDAVFTLENIRGVWLGLVGNGWTGEATLNSISLAVPVTIMATGIGVLLAWAVTRTDMPGRRTFEVLFLLPMLYSPLVGVIGWSVLADPRAGLLNQIWWIGQVERPFEPIINIYSWFGIVWVMVFYFVPYAFVMNVGTFRSMDPALEEAGNVHGANLWRRLTRITLPLMAASIGAAALFIFTLALEQFAIPGFLGSHIRFDTLAYAIYRRTNAYPNDLPGAAAAGTLLLVLAAVGLYFYRRLIRRSEKFVTVTARGYKPAPTSLGRLRWVVVILASLVLFLGSLLPLGAVLLRALMPVRTNTISLGDLDFRNFKALWTGVDIQVGVFNSLWLAAGAATLCATLGFVLAMAVARRPKEKPVAMADYLMAMPIGVPGTVFGVGMLWAYVGSPLYLTVWILLLAFVIRYTVYAVRSTTAGVIQVDRALEEAAVVSGASPVKAFLFVDLPLLKPVMAALWLLIFMIVMRELSASVILYGANSVTLPILTWSYLNDGFYGIASALAICQMLLVGLVVVVFRWIFGVDLRLRSKE